MDRPRPTRRGWTMLAALLLIGGAVVVLVVVRGGAAPCSVTVGERTVELGRDEADRAAVAVAYSRTKYGDTAAATTEVRRVTDLAERDATAVAAALSGEAKAALVCDGFGTSDESDELGAEGLTGRAERIRVDLRGHFRSMPLGGFAPGGVHDGHMPGSAHYEGRAIDAFTRPISAANKTRGWALAQYLVARAEHFDIDTVIFDDRIWTARRADEGWRDYSIDTGGRTRAVARVLEHRDHVHVDVAD